MALYRLYPFSLAWGKLVTGEDHASTFAGPPIALMRCLDDGLSPERAVEEVEQAILSNTSKYMDVFLVRGIALDERRFVDDGLSLRTAAEFPDHPLFKHVSQPRFETAYIPNAGFGSLSSVASCAIVAEYQVSPTIIEQGDPEPFKSIPHRVDRLNKVRSLAMALALSASGPIAVLAFTTHSLTPALSRGGWSAQGFLADGTLWGGQQLEWDDVLSLFNSMTRFAGLADLQLAVEHFMTASLASDDRQLSIGLGTALEVALLHGIEDHAELSHRIGFRGAWLMGSSPTERKLWYDTIRDIYEHRSVAVHGGKKPLKVNRAEVIGAVRMTLKTLAKREKFPNWNDIVFGAEIKSKQDFVEDH